jgi:hypothetical protein
VVVAAVAGMTSLLHHHIDAYTHSNKNDNTDVVHHHSNHHDK